MLRSMFREGQAVAAADYRTNFRHLYFDIAWYGILSGSAISFVSIYLVRIGASTFQVGLLSAAPAIVTLMFALPSGWWLSKQATDKAVFWSSVLFRFFYVLWIPLPILFPESTQIGLFLGLTFLMSVPGTVLAVGFNALFADVVPPEWRSHVSGVRNALLALTFTVTSLGCGYLLSVLPFELGYQIVFGIGAVGAVMSSLHLYFIRLDPGGRVQPRVGRSLGDLARPGFTRTLGDAMRPSTGLRFLTRRRSLRLPSLDILSSPFGPVLAALFVFHLAQFLAIPLFPIYWVERLGLSDQDISLGNAIFYVTVFLGSTQLSRITRRLGHHQVMVAGAVGMAAYPGLMAVTTELWLFLFVSGLGGLAWSLSGGAIGNYILDHVPEDERPSHLAWYNLALHAAILIGSLVGPIFADLVGLSLALALDGIARLLSAFALLRWGR